MSYEGRMLEQLAMPTRTQVGRALLRTLLKNGGVVKEFGASQELVDQLADEFRLNRAQRAAALQTVYRKEIVLRKCCCGIGCCFALLTRLHQMVWCPGRRRHLN